MTTLREAAQQALEALEYLKNTAICSADTEVADETVTALKAALAQEQAEPVQCSNTFGCRCPKHYTAPPQRTPLTDEEIDRITDQQWGAANGQRVLYAAFRTYARAVERAHGIGGQDGR